MVQLSKLSKISKLSEKVKLVFAITIVVQTCMIKYYKEQNITKGTIVMSYFINKEQRAEKARNHAKIMEEKYSEEIKRCVENTAIYDSHNVSDSSYRTIGQTCIQLYSADSVSTILFEKENDDLNRKNNKIAVLNFASFKNPGGMFYNGSSAQEESLCHESFLYNVLKRFENSYYKENKKHLNRALYQDRCLYSPSVVFRLGDTVVECDVITCAAPNKKAAQKYQNVTDEENLKVLKNRIKFIFNVANMQNVDTLILGAFGAGVFGQDPKEVASCFMAELATKKYNFKNVIFAVPRKNDDRFDQFNKNYYEFEKVMKEYKETMQTSSGSWGSLIVEEVSEND